ncbi:MAG TPA: OmpA family protein [Stellaceae bacterium]|nr:OmpA family protein [Stellaceae bacterium]
MSGRAESIVRRSAGTAALAFAMLLAVAGGPARAQAPIIVGGSGQPDVWVDESVIDSLGPPPTLPGLLRGTLPGAVGPDGKAIHLRRPGARVSSKSKKPAAHKVASAEEERPKIKLTPPPAAPRPKVALTPPNPRTPVVAQKVEPMAPTATAAATPAPPATPPPTPPAPSAATPAPAPAPGAPMPLTPAAPAPTVAAASPPPPAASPAPAAAAPTLRGPSGVEGAPSTPAAAPAPAQAAAAPPPPAPPPPAAPSRAPQQTAALPAGGGLPGRITFPPNVTDVAEQAKPTLDAVIRSMKADDQLRIQLIAYASGAPDQTSQARRVSLSRAIAVRSYLIEQGVRSTRIDVRALGNRPDSGGPADRVDIVAVDR